MTIALLVTGNEIIEGDTLDTNSHAIAHALSSEGLPLGLRLTCGDEEEAIIDSLTFLCKKHDILLLLGGLGPTSDDRTRFALAHFLKTPLQLFPEALAHIEARLNRANLSMNEGNRQQALFPKEATLLSNLHGTAMGCHYVSKGKQFFLLPGPPRECLSMFNQEALPLLRKTEHQEKRWLKWRLFGVAEGIIAQELDNALASVDCETGYRVELPYIEFKVRCKNHQVTQVKQIIEPLVSSCIIATPEKRASELLRERIEQLQEPISIVDEVTGGLLQTLLLRPGNYHLLSFFEKEISNRFYLQGLENYWLQKSASTDELTIQYLFNSNKRQETHTIPCYSSYVTHYAAEWLSFRMLQLINELH